jgi:hypothetical protein
MEIYKILEEFNETNSTLDKRKVCQKYKDNEIFLKVFQMAYDKVKYTYGITMKNIPSVINSSSNGLEWALNELESKFVTREYTGNRAKKELMYILESLSKEDAGIIVKILDRDLKIRFGKKEFNGVVDSKHRCVKPPYMRCGLYNEKTAKKIKFPAYVQLKADGMFQAIIVDNGSVTFQARSGEERELPYLEELFNKLPDGVYIGELLVDNIQDRAIANGFINSDEKDKSSVYVQLWDFISLDEYARAKDKNNKTKYIIRFKDLQENISKSESYGDRIRLIPSIQVENIQEALRITSQWMNDGYEGAILKDMGNIFIDHTSPTQLKLKLEISIDVRCVGFTEGKPGTKREKTFGAMIYETDDARIKGRCSGFSDKELEQINKNRDSYVGKVFEVCCNDILKTAGNDYHSLNHTRFIEFRDKDETDTLEKALASKQSAMMLGEEL